MGTTRSTMHSNVQSPIISNTQSNDMVCSICKNNVVYMVKSSCEHCFCGRCFCEYWHQCSSLRQPNCPVCLRKVKSLKQNSNKDVLNSTMSMAERQRVDMEVDIFNRRFIKVYFPNFNLPVMRCLIYVTIHTCSALVYSANKWLFQNVTRYFRKSNSNQSISGNDASDDDDSASSIMSIDTICPICQNDIVYMVTTNCGHDFCGKCFCAYSRYISTQPNCPLCRDPVCFLEKRFNQQVPVSDIYMTDRQEVDLQVNIFNRRFSGQPAVTESNEPPQFQIESFTALLAALGALICLIMVTSSVLAFCLAHFLFRNLRRQLRVLLNMIYPGNRQSEDEVQSGNRSVSSSTLSGNNATSVTPIEANNQICPICRYNIVYMVETNCGHTFCGACFFAHFHLVSDTRKLFCRVCLCKLHFLIKCFNEDVPVSTISMADRQKVDAKVINFNRSKFQEHVKLPARLSNMPVLLRHAVPAFVLGAPGIPSGLRIHLLFLVLLVISYIILPFDLIPESRFGVFGLLDDVVIVLHFCLHVADLYRRHIILH